MRKERINIWEENEYDFDMAYGFKPNIVTYISENEKDRPFILVVPGGGYCYVSPTEGEIVALDFYNKGYNVGVLTYTVNILMRNSLERQPMNDLSRAIRYIRKNICKTVMICGFSAGGHLAGTLTVHHNDIKDENEEYKDISCKPNLSILSYPVISGYEYAHRGSFIALLGEDEKELDYFSLEKNVTKDTPPVFIWHTVPDSCVPVQNTNLFVDALIKNNIPFASHLFSKGDHGLSLANDKWVKGEFGEPYPLEQGRCVIKAIEEGLVEVEPNQEKELRKCFFPTKADEEEYPRFKNDEVADWIKLADEWIKANL